MSHAPDTRVRSSRQSGSRLVTVLRRMRWPVVIAWLNPAGFPRTGPGIGLDPAWTGPGRPAATCPSQMTPAPGAAHDRHTPAAAVGGCSGGRSARALPGAGVSASGGPASYEIRVEGILDGRWAA